MAIEPETSIKLCSSLTNCATQPYAIYLYSTIQNELLLLLLLLIVFLAIIHTYFLSLFSSILVYLFLEI